jgi:hypothetical protein
MIRCIWSMRQWLVIRLLVASLMEKLPKTENGWFVNFKLQESKRCADTFIPTAFYVTLFTDRSDKVLLER